MSFQAANLNASIRAFKDSEWEDCVPLRWVAQLAVGALPGLLLVLAIMQVAHTVPVQGGRQVTAASMVPLLSASALADNAAFHRVGVTPQPATSGIQFRAPRVDASVHQAKAVAKPVVHRAIPVSMNAQSPRQNWQHLDAQARAHIDEAQPVSEKWSGVVLHGSGATRGSAHMLERYRANVQSNAGYHFVIGNGNGANDGRVEVTDRWMEPSAVVEANAERQQINICLVGDFQQRAPTQAQLEALDELLDYLSLKLGSVPVTMHMDASGKVSDCLGSKFPVTQVLR